MFDEIAIKKYLFWDGNRVFGYEDVRTAMTEKGALVFMVTALNSSRKIPVGYCLLNGLSANAKL